MKTSLVSRKAIISIAAIAISILIPSTSQAQVIAPGDTIAGFTQQELAARWFQWSSPIPVGPGPNLAQTSTNPAVETHGSASHLGNNVVPGVSFLAGVYSSLSGTDSILRHMAIPEGNTIFFPIINAFADNTVPSGQAPTTFTINELLTSGFGLNYITSFQNPASLFVTVDGSPIGGLLDHLQVNGDGGFITTYTGPDSIIAAFGYDATFNTNVYPAEVPTAGIGYWVGLTLPKGNHTVSFGGNIPVLDPNGQPLGFNFTQTNITYNLAVGAPEPGTFALLGIGSLALGALALRRARKR